MKPKTARASNPLRARIAWLLAAVLVIGLRLLIPPRGMDTAGFIAILDSAISVGLWMLIHGIAAGLGLLLLRVFSLQGLSASEKLVLGFALGIGTLSYLLLTLGLLRALERATILALMTSLAFAVGPYAQQACSIARHTSVQVVRWLWGSSSLHKAFLVLALAIAALAFIHALSPPWDYDGLMYHLPGPRLFLEHGGITPETDNWRVNGPFTVEMIFTIGLAFEDDVFAKLIHYSFGCLYVIAAALFAKRWLTPDDAVLSAGVLLTMPTLPMWAALAYIDLGWASFEFLALFGVMIGWRTRNRRYYLLAGVLSGFAMGSKYLGLAGFAVLGAFLVVAHIREGWSSFFRGTLSFALPAILVAMPWYLKNWIWFGNPVYPLFFGGPAWDAARLDLYMGYLRSFGVGRSALDYLLLPWSIYARHAQFGTLLNLLDIPSVLFPLLLFYAILEKSRLVSISLLLAGIQCALWTLGSQQTRFLMPVFPIFAVGTAYVANRILTRAKSRIPWKIFFPSLTMGLMALTLFYQVVIVMGFSPQLPALGLETRREFLSRIVRDFPATNFINNNLPPTSRTLFS